MHYFSFQNMVYAVEPIFFYHLRYSILKTSMKQKEKLRLKISV